MSPYLVGTPYTAVGDGCLTECMPRSSLLRLNFTSWVARYWKCSWAVTNPDCVAALFMAIKSRCLVCWSSRVFSGFSFVCQLNAVGDRTKNTYLGIAQCRGHLERPSRSSSPQCLERNGLRVVLMVRSTIMREMNCIFLELWNKLYILMHFRCFLWHLIGN